MTSSCPEASATRPGSQLTAIAASSPPGDLRNFKPSDAHRALAGALIEHPQITTFTELAEKAGISRSQLYEIKDDETAVAWVVNEVQRLMKLSLGMAYVRLREMAFTSRNPTWMKMFLERFDDALKTLAPGTTHNTQYNFITGMTSQELQAYVREKVRQTLGNPS